MLSYIPALIAYIIGVYVIPDREGSCRRWGLRGREGQLNFGIVFVHGFYI